MKKLLILFALFAGTILLTQIIPAEARDSEARKQAALREKQILEAEAKKKYDKEKKALETEKKTLDAVAKVIKPKEAKGKSAADSKNAARLKVISDAEINYDNAKNALNAAEKAYKADQTNPTLKQAFADAKKAFEKAKIDRKLAKLG
jgi:adenine specific DNA methylase Mod